jgi:hypothetical protein
LKKHVDAYHDLIARKFEEEVNNPLERQPTKKRATIIGSEISLGP